MNPRMFFLRFVWVGVAGVVASLCCLIASGMGDDPESFRSYLLCASIVLGASLLALALAGRQDDK